MLPSAGQVSSVKPASEYQTAVSFSAPASAWPSERWWQTYGDPQLNTLVDEALRDSPDTHSTIPVLVHRYDNAID